MRRFLFRQQFVPPFARPMFSFRPCRLAARVPSRPFSHRDELELSHMLATKPESVSPFIRKRVIETNQHPAQFRNMVTFLMIALQTKLQAKELSPQNAERIIDAILAECAVMKQGDMAHLLFRAAVRFRKFGVVLSYRAVRSVYDSFRAGDESKELMGSIGDEFRHDDQFRSVALMAYMLAERVADAAVLKDSVTQQDITVNDYVALIEGNGRHLNFNAIKTLALEALRVEHTNASICASTILSAAIISARGSAEGVMTTLVDKAAAEGVSLSEKAVAVVCRIRFSKAPTFDELVKAREDCKKQFRREKLGIIADAHFVVRLTNLISKGHVQELHDALQAELKDMRAVLDRFQASLIADSDHSRNQDVVGPVIVDSSSSKVSATATTTMPLIDDDCRELLYDALIRGHSLVNQVKEMREVLQYVRDSPTLAKNPKYLEEAMRCLSFNLCHRDLFALIDEAIEDRQMTLTESMFVSVFRVLGKNYPVHAKKYYAVMSARNIAKTGVVFPWLIRTFDELRDDEVVQELIVALRAKQQKSEADAQMSPKLLCTLLGLRSLSIDDKRKLIKDGAKQGLLSNHVVQAALVRHYSETMSDADFERFLSAVPQKSPHVYAALLQNYIHSKSRQKFEACITDIRRHGFVVGEKLFGLMIKGYCGFDDSHRVRLTFDEAVASGRVRNAYFFSHAAQSFASFRDIDGVNECWQRMLDAHCTIDLEVYNRFLDIYAGFNHTAKLHEVLGLMMKNEPPNATTATTVLDVLGRMGRIPEMETVLEEMNKSSVTSPTADTYHQAMYAYAKSGDVDKMEATRCHMRDRGIAESAVTYNILAEGYRRAKRYDHIEGLMRERASKGIPMDSFSYVLLLRAMTMAKNEERIAEVASELLASGIDLTSSLLHALAHAYHAVGDMARAEHYVGLLLAHPRRAEKHIHGIFLMYAKSRDIAKVEELMEKVEKSAFVLNTSVIAFAKSGNFVKVGALLQEMEERGYNLAPNAGLILSSLLVRAGKSELAQAVLQMKSVSAPNLSVLGKEGGSAAQRRKRD